MQLASRNLNAIAPIPADSLLGLARQVEIEARATGDISREFQAKQIEVNTYGLTNNFGLAINKAHQMLEEAEKIDSPLAKGLSLQAMANTYMHSRRITQADSLYTEAAPYITQYGNPEMRIRLTLQQLHTSLFRQDATKIQVDLHHLNSLFEVAGNIPALDTYRFIRNCYEAFYTVMQGDTERSRQMMVRLLHENPSQEDFNPWLYFLASQYHARAGEYDEALRYCDSTLAIANSSLNKTTLPHILQLKADLLEQTGKYDEACDIYKQVQELNDSLYRTLYTTQIDSLHVTYWVDHLQVSNLTQRNEFFTKLIFGLSVLVLLMIVLGIYIRRKNRQLRQSRTQLEELRKASDDSIRTKSRFLSDMSHELRTPLNAIMGFSALLTENEEPDEETQRECGSYIRQNADLLMKLISDVVDFSQLQGDSYRFTYSTCNVVELCRNTLKTVENVKNTVAEIRFDCDLDKLEICTDGNRLQQVLINLLVNATKFTQTGVITLTLRKDAARNEVIFAVEDTGCGIPLEKQGTIFERFEKLHEGVQGTGLGLSICKLIVEHCGGRIWIDPTYTQGTRFIFTLPLHFTPKDTQA